LWGLIVASVTAMDGEFYENYSFDYSRNEYPLGYTTYGNAIELNHYVKLNSDVKSKGGAVVLDP